MNDQLPVCLFFYKLEKTPRFQQEEIYALINPKGIVSAADFISALRPFLDNRVSYLDAYHIFKSSLSHGSKPLTFSP